MNIAAAELAHLDEVTQHLAAIVAHSNDAIVSKDLNGIIKSWNLGAELLFGYTAEEAIGKPISMLAPPERLEEMAAILQHIRDGMAVEHFETKRRHKNGNELSISVSISPIRDSSGRIIGASKIARDIGEQRRLEAASLRLAAIVEDSDDAIISKDLRGIITSWNKGAQRIFGYTAEEVIGQPVSILAPERRDEMPQILERIRRGERVDHYETIRRRKDGTAIHVSLTVSPMHNSSGEIIGASKIARDITERRRAEEAIARATAEIRRSEELFRTMANAIPHLSWMCNAEGATFWYNTRWYEYTGAAPGQEEGREWHRVIDPDVFPEVLDRWKAALASGDAFENIAPVRGADGRFRPFLIRVSPVKDSDGGTVRWFGTATDISEQQNSLEREHEARQTAELLNGIGPLLLSELDLQRLSNSIIELATKLTGAEFGALYRRSPDEPGLSYAYYTPLGPASEVGVLTPDTDLAALGFRGERLIRDNDITTHPGYTAVFPAGNFPEGQSQVRSYLAVPIQSRSREVLGGLFFGHRRAGMFTERHEQIVTGIAAQSAIALDNARLFAEKERTQAALQFVNEHLQRANSDLEQFAYSASHDLQEPIRNIAIYGEILQKHYAPITDPTARQAFDVVIEGARRMEMLVRGLLAYTRITGAEDQPIELVDAADVLSKALANLSESIRESGAHITAGDLPQIWVHGVHLQQILQNLVGNAIKYRRAAPPDVTISAGRVEGGWRFAVQDNGIGISHHHREKIFGIFKRLHTSSEYHGTGMGLAICKRLVERYRGKIWVESEPERGSTFFFTIPDKPANP